MVATAPDSVAQQQLPQPTFQVLPLAQVHPTGHNPRGDADADLSSLTASLAALTEPYFAEPPLVEQVGEDDYRILAGERRIRAARDAGWTTVACLVYPPIDPVVAHTVRLVENLHRQELHPIDEAVALKLSWAVANLDALGLHAEVCSALAAAPTLLVAVQTLLPLLEEQPGFVPTHPPVTWDDVLNRLGVALSKDDRKRLLRLLSLDPEVHARVRDLDLSDAAMRALGTLEPDQQRYLVEEIVVDRGLIGRIRRIARVVRDGDYTLEEAIAEARGQVRIAPDSNWSAQRDMPATVRNDDDALSRELPDDEGESADEMEGQGATQVNQTLIDAVMGLIAVASSATEAVTTLHSALDGRSIAAIGEPWSIYVQYALTTIQDATKGVPV